MRGAEGQAQFGVGYCVDGHAVIYLYGCATR